jgi:hypothetical protein
MVKSFSDRGRLGSRLDTGEGAVDILGASEAADRVCLGRVCLGVAMGLGNGNISYLCSQRW